MDGYKYVESLAAIARARALPLTGVRECARRRTSPLWGTLLTNKLTSSNQRLLLLAGIANAQPLSKSIKAL